MGFKITSKPPQAEKWKRRSRLDGKLILTVLGLSESCQNPRLSAYPTKHHLFTAPVNKYPSNWLPTWAHVGTKLGGKIWLLPSCGPFSCLVPTTWCLFCQAISKWHQKCIKCYLITIQMFSKWGGLPLSFRRLFSLLIQTLPTFWAEWIWILRIFIFSIFWTPNFWMSRSPDLQRHVIVQTDW